MEHCTLCPRRCGARRDETGGAGFCGLPSVMRIARIAPHLWEEPPISGTRGTGAVFFSGCTLRCVYCQNRDISHTGAGRMFTPPELAESLRRLVEEKGVHTVSFITATPFLGPILETLAIYRPPVPLVWNTSGYETAETLRRLEGVIDVYLPDLKHFSPRMAKLCCGAPGYFDAASAAIREMVWQTGLPQIGEDGIMRRGTLIRHLILPGLTGESIALLRWVRENLPEGVPVSVMSQYVPNPESGVPALNRRITAREAARVEEAQLALGIPGFTQEKSSASGDFVPAFNRTESFV